MPDATNVISRLKANLEINPSVTAFVLVGSQAREDIYIANQYSDLEAYIVVKDNEAENLEKHLPEIVSNLDQIIFSYKNRWAGFSVVFEDLFRLELPLVKQSELYFVFSRPKAQTIKVIFDKTGGELEKVLNSRPEKIDFKKIFQDIVEDFWYMTIVCVQYYKKGEIWNARHALEVISIPSLIKLFELLEDPNILLLESNKRIEQFLTEEQLDLLREISAGYNSRGINRALIKVIELFSETAKAVKEKYSYHYDESIVKNIKPKLLEFLKG